MKGNFKLKGSFLLMFLVLCWVKPTSGLAQCESKIFLNEVTKTSPTGNDGSIVISVETSGVFECVLYVMTSTHDELVHRIEGQGNQVVEFNNLRPHNLYKVVATFSGEENLMCRKRNLSDLSTIE